MHLCWFCAVPRLLPARTWVQKPSVVIDFKGLEDENYYVTLLSKTDSTGPYSAITKGPGYTMYESGDEDYDVFLKFAGYEDGDGYYFLQYFKNCG